MTEWPDPPRSPQLHELAVRGFGTLADVRLQLRATNVLIGANASGKSNVVKLFRLLNRMQHRPGELQKFVAEEGGASQLLHFGPRRTRQIELGLRIGDSEGRGFATYEAHLSYVAGDRLLFSEERFGLADEGGQQLEPWADRGSGHQESRLLTAIPIQPVAAAIAHLLQRIRVYQFHDTSPTGPLRQNSSERGPRYLAGDGSNLPAFLMALSDEQPAALQRVEDHIRLIYPAFGSFSIESVGPAARLKWREQGRDYMFDAHQASDGTLRFFALAALLLQPHERLPAVLILDEPELGLHPSAIDVLGNLLRAASDHCQLIISTQSPQLLDEFEPGDVITVERHQGASQFRRLDPAELKAWLEEFEGEPGLQVSELWKRNIIGGGPSV